MKPLFNHKKNIEIMGIIDDKRKFKPNKKQSNPTNPTGNTNIETNTFNIDEKTLRKKQSKK